MIIPDDYKLVYQGGHHQVYCNGTKHITTVDGGYTQAYPETRIKHHTNCDCEKYKEIGEPTR